MIWIFEMIHHYVIILPNLKQNRCNTAPRSMWLAITGFTELIVINNKDCKDYFLVKSTIIWNGYTTGQYISEYQRNKCRIWAGFPGDPVLQTGIAAVRMGDVSLPQGFPNGGRQAGKASIKRVFVWQWIHQRVNNTLFLSAPLGSERKQQTWVLKPALPLTRD